MPKMNAEGPVDSFFITPHNGGKLLHQRGVGRLGALTLKGEVSMERMREAERVGMPASGVYHFCGLDFVLSDPDHRRTFYELSPEA